MDLNFFRRAEQRFASRTAAPLDFGLLVAMLQTRQAASAAARAHALWSERSAASGSSGRIAARGAAVAARGGRAAWLLQSGLRPATVRKLK